jgi:hypothetical protein
MVLNTQAKHRVQRKVLGEGPQIPSIQLGQWGELSVEPTIDPDSDFRGSSSWRYTFPCHCLVTVNCVLPL